MKKLALLIVLVSTLAVAQTVTLTTTTAGNGSGTISGCAGTHTSGDYVSCHLVPDAGSYMAGASGCGLHFGGNLEPDGTVPWYGPVTTNCTVTGTFNLLTSRPLPMLTGATPASYTLPSNWTLVAASNFESGTIGTACGDGMVYSTAPATGHGSQACGGIINKDDSTTRIINISAAGARCIYGSWYEYDPNTAGFFGEMFIANLAVPDGSTSIHIDFFNPNGNPTPLSSWENAKVANPVVETEGPTISRTDYTASDQTIGYDSAWHQWQYYGCPNTPNNADGKMLIWHDGSLLIDYEQMMFNNEVDFSAGLRMEVGGVYTAIMSTQTGGSTCSTLAQTCVPNNPPTCVSNWGGAGIRCTDFSTACPCTAGGTPASDQPQPAIFNRYFDDMIIASCSTMPCGLSTTVTVSPTSISLPYLGTQQFTASTSSSWTATCGSVSPASGTTTFYTAPSASGVCTVSATASGTTGNASVTVAALAVTPATASLNVGATQQFTSNFPSTWSATGGTISSSGLYTAPSTNGTYTITATATNGGTTATATVTVTGEQTFIPLSISPTSWTQQTTISTPVTKTFTATNIGTGLVTPTVTLSGAAAFTISANTCTGAVSGGGNCTVTAQFLSATVGTFSGNLNISDTAGGNQNLPLSVSIPSGTTVSISPTTVTIPINGTQQFSASTSNGSGVTWATNCTGSSVTAGNFTAGGSADLCTVTATTTDGSGANAIASVTIVTVAVNPSAVTLQINSKQQFTANVSATWSASCGTITSSGFYTAPAAPASCTITATALNGGATGTATATVHNPPPGTHGSSQKGGRGRWKVFH